MRNDIRQGVFENMKDHVKPNYATLGRQYNADYRTVKKAFEEAQSGQLKTTKTSKSLNY